MQTADEAELVLFVAKDTSPKDIKVALLPGSITVTNGGELVFSEKLPEIAYIKKEGSNWSLMKKVNLGFWLEGFFTVEVHEVLNI